MVDPATHDSLYKTDEEIARLVGVGVDRWREIARTLERGGLPRRDPLFSHRRYWPSVKAFLDRRNGLGTDSRKARTLAPDGEEHPERIKGSRPRAAATS